MPTRFGRLAFAVGRVRPRLPRSASFATDTTMSPSSISIRRTPWVARPIVRMPPAFIRRIMPCWLISISSIVVVDVGDADDLAVAIGGLDVDDADAAARLQAVFLEPGPLAVAVLRDGEQRAALAHHVHRHDLVVVAQADAADAVRAAAHRPDVGLVEANRHAVARAEEDLLLAVRELDGDDRVPVFDPHRDDAARRADS